jgi:hypothetical protein
MLHAIFKKLAKLGRRHIGTKPCPDIRWDEVARIKAFGTDAFGVFEVWLVIFHNDGTEARLQVEHRGYDKILESLPQRFPSIPSTWYDEMAETPWDVERVLYSKSDPVA